MSSLPALITAQPSAHGSALERSVFGTDDAIEIADLLRRWCHEHLGAPVAGVWLWAVSVGCVAGLDLGDGRRVVVKAHPPDRSPSRLAAVIAVQRHAIAAGLPAPTPCGEPRPLGLGWAVAEESLVVGRRPTLDRSPDVDTVARGWVDLTAALNDAAALLRGGSPTAAGRVVDGLYPVPHSPLFDFEATSAGAEWIDDLASTAWNVIRSFDEPGRVVHLDWRGPNLRVSNDGTGLVAIYDWDSVRIEPEAVALGQVAAMHSVDWETPNGPYFATAAECVAFAVAVERSHPAPFSNREWRALRAAIVHGWAYTARAEHARAFVGDDKPQFGMRRRLRAEGAALLGTL